MNKSESLGRVKELRTIPVFCVLFSLIALFDTPMKSFASASHAYPYRTRECHTIHFTIIFPAGMEGTATRAAQILEEGYYRASVMFAHERSAIMRVIIAPGRGESHSSSHPFLYPKAFVRYIPEPEIEISFIGSFRDFRIAAFRAIARVFMHDLMLRGNVFSAFGRFDGYRFWLSEAMAAYCAEGGTATATAATFVKRGADIGSDIAAWLGSSCNERGDCLARAYLLILFLEEQYGPTIIAKTARGIPRCEDLAGLLQYATGMEPRRLQGEWDTFLKKRIREPTSQTREKHRIVVSSHGSVLSNIAVAPDGSRVAYCMSDPVSARIAVAELATGKVRTLVREGWGMVEDLPIDGNRLSWSPDGRQIFFIARVRGSEAICAADAAHGRVSVIAKLPFLTIMDPCVSNDGRLLAFAASTGGASDIFIYDLVKRTVERITDNESDDRYPVPLASGESIIVTSNAHDSEKDETGSLQLVRIERATGKRRVITSGCGDCALPALSPDGRSIAYVNRAAGVTRVMLHRFDRAEQDTVASLPQGSSFPSWLPKGEGLMAVMQDNNGFHIVRVEQVDPETSDLNRDLDSSKTEYPPAPMSGSDILFRRSEAFTLRNASILMSVASNNCMAAAAGFSIGDSGGRHALLMKGGYEAYVSRKDYGATVAYIFRQGIWELSGRALAHKGLFDINRNRINLIGTIYSPHGHTLVWSAGGGLGSACLITSHLRAGMDISAYIDNLRDKVEGFKHREYPNGRLSPSIHLAFDNMRVQSGIPLAGLRFVMHLEHEAVLNIGMRHAVSIASEWMGSIPLFDYAVLNLRGAAAYCAGPASGDYQQVVGGADTMRGYGMPAAYGRGAAEIGIELFMAAARSSRFGTPSHGGFSHFGGVIFVEGTHIWKGAEYGRSDYAVYKNIILIDCGFGFRVAAGESLILKLDFAWPFDTTSFNLSPQMRFSMSVTL